MAARRLHHLIYATIVNCCLFLIVCGIALGTNKWFSLSTSDDFERTGGSSASFGLFRGEKTRESISTIKVLYKLRIVCSGLKGCLFSCGTTAEKRKQDLESLLSGRQEQDYLWCTEQEQDNANEIDNNGTRSISEVKPQQEEESSTSRNGGERHFINFGLYISTIAFLGLAMIFAIISGMLALYNTYRTPIQPWLSVYGLYYWNGAAAFLVLLSMIMWIMEFVTRLRKNGAISETVDGTFDASGRGSLGISFWILILPILFALTNVVVLFYRKWRIVKMEEKTVRVMKTDQDEYGEAILF